MAEEHAGNTRDADGPVGDDRGERIKPYQWKKGQSGNPGGRPKHESLTAKLRRVLESEHNGREIADLIAERIVREALAGKFPFAKELLDRIEWLPGKEQRGDQKVVIQVIDVPGGPPREFTKLRDFYQQCPARLPEGNQPSEGDAHGT